MSHYYRNSLVIFFSILLILCGTVDSFSWVGVEIDTSVTAIDDTWDTAGGDGGYWGLSGRIVVQEPLPPFDLELHWLTRALGAFGDQEITGPFGGSPFRSLDMEKTHEEDSRNALTSEIDRLTINWAAQDFGITLGRQAVTWGEAYYFNINDLFGAFPITQTNRLYKQGIDALSATVRLGQFSDLALVTAPSGDNTGSSEDNVAANVVMPLGAGSMTLTGGRILDNDKLGIGYTTDLGGAKLYGTYLLTSEDGGDRFSETVAGVESQVGPYTHLVGELYINGWGTDDPDKYTDLISEDRYKNRLALTLGRVNAVLQISRQMTPLLTVTPALFANLSDGSALTRLDGGWSFSDLTSISGGIFVGLGERPEAGIWKSE